MKIITIHIFAYLTGYVKNMKVCGNKTLNQSIKIWTTCLCKTFSNMNKTENKKPDSFHSNE